MGRSAIRCESCSLVRDTTGEPGRSCRGAGLHALYDRIYRGDVFRDTCPLIPREESIGRLQDHLAERDQQG